MSAVKLVLDGREVSARTGETVLDVARREGVYIPTLCFDERLAPFGACRVCLVGVAGARGPVASCTTPVREGLVVDTRDPVARKVARSVVELVLSDYPPEAFCREGDRNELRQVARHFGLTASRYGGERHVPPRDDRHPYLKLNLSECIACARCARACDEVQGTFALSMAGRGFSTRVIAGLGGAVDESACVSCGACVSSCPTGAIDEAAFVATEQVDRTVSTTCGYCGVGCRLEVQVRGARIASIDPALDGPANRGHTCVKGRFAHAFVRSSERLTKPLLRENGRLREASWDEALSFIGRRLSEIRAQHGPDAVAGISSSRATNEENYAMQKLMRAVVGTHNVDNCSRVCHSPSAAGLLRSLGQSGGTGGFDAIEQARVLFVTGANPTEAHPVVGARLKQAALKGAKLIVVDPRRIELADHAEHFLQLRPGSNVAVFSAMAHAIVSEGLSNRAFLDARAEGVEAYLAFIEACTPEWAEGLSGVPAAAIREVARLYATGGPAGIYYGLGVTEHSHGTDGVLSLVNLALLTGNLGRDDAGVFPLRGQNNVQGASDSGALPNTFPMYHPVSDAEERGRYERAWKVKLGSKPGLTIPRMFDAALRGDLKALYVFGEDIAQTDPNSTHVVRALGSLELLVCQDLFLTETARHAHVVLPGASFLEKTGTFTNAERRIQRVEQAVLPPGEAKSDLEILVAVAKSVGGDLGFETTDAVMAEMAALVPELAGLTVAALGRTGLQWPVPAPGHPGTPVLYREKFATPTGRARLTPVPWKPPGEAADDDFPLVLVTGRQLAHYNAGTMTRRTGNLDLHPGDMLEVHPEDAARRGLADGDEAEVASRRGTLRAFVHLSTRVAPGNVFLSFHFPEVLANLLTSAHSDEVTQCPEYKVTAVRVRKVAEGAGRAPRWVAGIHPGA